MGTPHEERDAAQFAGGPGEKDRRGISRGENLYRLLVETVRDYAIFALDPDGYIISWNAGAQHLKGYTRDEAVGRHFSMFYPPEKVAEGFPQYELEVARGDGRFEDEGWRVRKDGTLFWASVVITALRDDAGTVLGFAKVTRDLTERRKAEEALRESERRFRLIVESVKDYAIFMLDPEGRVASWNRGAERIKGYRADEIIGRHFSAFFPSDDVAAGKPKRELEVAKREGRFEEEGWRLRKDGTLFWASVVLTAVYDTDEALVGFAKVTRDLTEQRAAHERAIADARRLAEIEAANRAKSEFLAAMSHELRTPINATLGYLELLELGAEGPMTAHQRGYFARVRTSQQHLLRIITDLLDYSRIEAGQISYDPTTVPVRTFIDAVIGMVEPQILAKGLVVDRGPCPDDVVAWADRTRAEQIVLNLLSNAVKFTPRGGGITIECAYEDAMVRIVVRDTGPGIAREQHGTIFEPFVQLGRSLTSGHEGAGLGLAISRDLARAMHGDLTVDSALGEGAAFVLTLPRAER